MYGSSVTALLVSMKAGILNSSTSSWSSVVNSWKNRLDEAARTTLWAFISSESGADAFVRVISARDSLPLNCNKPKNYIKTSNTF